MKKYRYICYFQPTPQWIRLSEEEREKAAARWNELIEKNDLTYLFGGDAWGVPERVVHVFESDKYIDSFANFLDDLNPDFIEHTRTIIVS